MKFCLTCKTPIRKKTKRKVKVSEAIASLVDDESSKLVNEEEIIKSTLDRVESDGIVFIDEIDKIITNANERSGGAVSREGVQRDLLPLLEGTTVNTKYGTINTDHILFIGSGAFMGVSPKDMISELQGRLPLKVELKSLGVSDLERIFVEPEASLSKQYQALLATEKIDIHFSDCGVKEIARLSHQLNESQDNIGARRLHSVVERVLSEISFNSDEYKGQKIVIDKSYVSKQLEPFIKKNDLSKWVL